MAEISKTTIVSEEPSKLKFALRALRFRNYRLYFGGQGLSLIGTWMTQVATSWLIFRLTNSALMLGLVGFGGQLPAVFLGPFAGVWIDRLNLHRLLKVTQTLSMLESFALATLAMTGHIRIWHVLVLTMFQGAVNAFDFPARQAFLVQMIDDRVDLPNAIALNSSMVNGSRLVGPSIAGIIIAIAGEGYCFLIDGFSYLAVIASLVLMRISVPPLQRKRENIIESLRSGWDYVAGFLPIRSILLLTLAVSLVAVPYMVLLPIFASDVLGGGPHTLGFLTAASGFGALISAITLALRKSIVGLGKRIAISACTFGAGLIAFGVSHWVWLSVALMMVVGFSMMQQLAASNTVIQTIVDEDKRGRVMSFYTMSFTGVAPFGSLLIGLLANKIGAPLAVICGGGLCLAAGMWFSFQLKEIVRAARPIYVELGISPEIATGIQTATALQTPPD